MRKYFAEFFREKRPKNDEPGFIKMRTSRCQSERAEYVVIQARKALNKHFIRHMDIKGVKV